MLLVDYHSFLALVILTYKIFLSLDLQLYSGDSLENLPDSLDIGDVSEAGSSSAQKLKVSGEGDNMPGSSHTPK